MSTAHGPGVACIVVGVKDQWGGKNNGRIVVIQKLEYELPKKGAFWRCAARPGEGALYAYRRTNVSGIQPVMLRSVTIRQCYLIPIAPEERLNEQVVGTEVDDGELVLV